ncbi:DMT family transporter [Actinocorallia sp. A-T 12471]|uniref:DMT family transporter n=1 Tax=Actinocorallia sp. A-T 12471 TaxID=3089813 RepID=UPI0029CC14FE|nr:DMT family transporter [Actinocorallia sp. A-T 12471]MDX6740223.1 DMT family transporter [Actinocorallia sp. A-T 12471]
MYGAHPSWVLVALAGPSVYFLSFVLFRRSARRMPPLRGSRPVRATFAMVRDPLWFAGGLLLFVGLLCQLAAFGALPSNVVQPLLGASLLPLAAYATGVLGERLSFREWTASGLAVLAIVLLGLSADSSVADLRTGDAMTLAPLLLVIAPPGLAAWLVWHVGDRRAGGRHALPLSGIAYGISAGMCAGVAEAGVRGMSAVWWREESVTAALLSPYPLLVLGMAGITLIQLQVALQRCRVIVVSVVMAISGRATMLPASTVLFAEPWPTTYPPLALRALSFTLVVLAVTTFPHHATPPPGNSRRAGVGR